MLALSKLLKVDLKSGLTSEQVHANDQLLTPSITSLEAASLTALAFILECSLRSNFNFTCILALFSS